MIEIISTRNKIDWWFEYKFIIPEDKVEEFEIILRYWQDELIDWTIDIKIIK